MAVNQEHLGGGDNVGRDKIINNIENQYNIVKGSLDPIDINQIVHDVMLTCITGKFEDAKNKLLPYQSLHKPIEEVGTLFDILLIYIDSLENNSLMPTDRLRLALSNKPSPYLEIYQYLLIKTIVKDNIDNGLRAYTRFSSNAKYYLLAAYDQYFSAKHELLTRLDNELYTLDDYLLFYLAQGLIRTNEHLKANIVLKQISNSNQTVNIQYWSIATEINSIIFSQKEPFSYINRDTSRKIESVSDRFLSIISMKQELELELLAVNILISLTKIAMATTSLNGIKIASLKFQGDISKLDEKMGDALKKIKDEEPFFIPESIVFKLKSNEGLVEDEMNSLVRAILHKNIDLDLLKAWLENCNEIIVYDDFDSNVIKSILLSFISFESEIKKNEYRVYLNDLIEESGESLKELNPYMVKTWCDNLFNLGKSFEVTVYKILNFLCQDLSVNSELNLYYLHSLLRLDKLDTLSKELSKIQDNEWNHDLYLFQARYYLKSSKYGLAQTTYNKFIDKEKSLYVWHEYLLSCMEGGEDPKLAKQQLSRIPTPLFSLDKHEFEFFLFQVGFFIDFDFIEAVIVKLFIDNPYKSAPIITNFYLNSFSSRVNNNFEEDKVFENVYGGVTYEIDGKQYLKLLVDSNLAIHKDLISIESELGKKLNNLDIGGEAQYRLETVKLLERETVSATIYDLAMKIVDESQHNYPKPLFEKIKLSEVSPLEDLSAYLQKIKQDNPIEESIEEFLRKSDLPLYVKGMKAIQSSMVKEEVEIVHSLLLNKNANKCLTKSYSDITEFNALTVDIYGILYLCVTNLYKSMLLLGTSIYVSEETDRAIRLWISNVTNDSFLRINEYEGQVSTINSNSTHYFHGELICALQTLLDNSIIEKPKEFDLPTIVSEVKNLGLVSDSVFSSIKIALSHEIPWLCLDSVIGGFIKTGTECNLISLHHLVMKFTDEKYLTFDDRKNALKYMAFYGLYFQYYLTDLIELSKEIDDLIILTNLLNDTTINFPDSEIAVSLLASLMKNIVLIGFNKRIVHNSLIGKIYLEASIVNNMYGVQGNKVHRIIIEQAISACMTKAIKSIDGLVAEDRLAKLVLRFMIVCSDNNHRKFLYRVLQNFAFGRFLKIEYVMQSLQRLVYEYSGE
ncbi:hypothetical protein [Psychrobacter sp. DM4]|uniref:hypothetical protein n=1 Tax=Psychrobacter sp. DM4 TaxID=3440637 RepID=UPI003F50B53D